MVNGVGSIAAADVPVALTRGLEIIDTNWPAQRVAHLSAPAGAWPSDVLTLPDGSTAQITGPIASAGSITGGSGYANGTYSNVPLTGGAGSFALATIVVTGGAVSSVAIMEGGFRYSLADSLSASAASIGGTGSGFEVGVSALSRKDALIPQAWINQFKQNGWFPTPVLSFGE
jgi:hypothetical protein